VDAPVRKRPACHFGTDGWSELDCSPIEDQLAVGEDRDVGLARLGWFEFSRTGRAAQDGGGTGSPLHVLVLHRPNSPEGPRFLVEVGGNIGGDVERVFVQDLASLMTLLAAWAPALQSTALTNLASALPSDPSDLAVLFNLPLRSRLLF
jgi:hypothetical protein